MYLYKNEAYIEEQKLCLGIFSLLWAFSLISIRIFRFFPFDPPPSLSLSSIFLSFSLTFPSAPFSIPLREREREKERGGRAIYLLSHSVTFVALSPYPHPCSMHSLSLLTIVTASNSFYIYCLFLVLLRQCTFTCARRLFPPLMLVAKSVVFSHAGICSI